MTEQRISRDVLAERLVKIPPIVDMDSHVVEPPGVWRDRLPGQLRDVGPRIEYAPAGRVQLIDGKYVETPGTGGPEAAWWVFDGVRTQIKRYIASAGVPAEEVTNEGITYDDMRPGCGPRTSSWPGSASRRTTTGWWRSGPGGAAAG